MLTLVRVKRGGTRGEFLHIPGGLQRHRGLGVHAGGVHRDPQAGGAVGPVAWPGARGAPGGYGGGEGQAKEQENPRRLLIHLNTEKITGRRQKNIVKNMRREAPEDFGPKKIKSQKLLPRKIC